MPENMDAMVEASRVFGNFSRSKEVRTLLAEHKGRVLWSTPYNLTQNIISKYIII